MHLSFALWETTAFIHTFFGRVGQEEEGEGERGVDSGFHVYPPKKSNKK